jgi:hypothetical protein
MQHHDMACFDSFKRILDFKTNNAADFTGADAASVKATASFVELGHATTFVQDLQNQVTAFNAADDSKSTGAQARSGATASIGPLILEGLTAGKQLDALMHNKYAGNAAKLGAWLTASHIEHRNVSPKAQPQTATAQPHA